jgi:2-octaprenyl-6-methoxyphenol hydroxylase
MKPSVQFDVIIAGSGPAGLAASLAFASAGFRAALIGPQRKSADLRTTALMVPAVSMLRSLGVWPQIEPRAAPLRAMRIIDGTRRLIRARPVTFQAGEIGEEAFGWNMPNEALLSALMAKVGKTAEIQYVEGECSSFDLHGDGAVCRLSGGIKLSAKLVIAADGRKSLAREAAGIAVKTWSYPQLAMVLSFAHGRPHGGISTEFHTETGPFTQVPLPGARSSLVWAVPPQDGDEMRAVSNADLALRIEEKMQSMLGKISIDSARQFYPLTGQTPERFAANRVMLTGEAAHVFPPIGAQGLNLGLRDVGEAVKAALAAPDGPGSDKAMQAYNTARRADVLLRTGAVDLLNRSLLSDFLPVQLARSLGLGALGALPMLRGLFIREGLRPGSGFKAVFRPGETGP